MRSWRVSGISGMRRSGKGCSLEGSDQGGFQAVAHRFPQTTHSTLQPYLYAQRLNPDYSRDRRVGRARPRRTFYAAAPHWSIRNTSIQSWTVHFSTLYQVIVLRKSSSM